MNLDDLRKIAEEATPGPWERGDRWHVQGASMCMCRERYGPLVAEVERDINGQLMLAHVHLGEEPWHEIGIVSSELYEGKYVQQVIVETDEYGTMSDEDALFVTTFNPHAVLALLDRVEKAEQEAFDFVKQKAKEGAREKRELESRVRKAEQALQRVRELHRRQPDTISGLDTGPAYCRCGEHYPCPTIRALEGDE